MEDETAHKEVTTVFQSPLVSPLLFYSTKLRTLFHSPKMFCLL